MLPVRKAYRKRALATHPDKLKPGATDEEKAKAEEEFLKVSHLCFVGYKTLTTRWGCVGQQRL